MTLPTDRRAVLAAAVLAVTGRAAAAQGIEGQIGFQGGTPVPEGTIEISLEDPAAAGRKTRHLSQTRVASDGRSAAVGFSLPDPAGAATKGLRLIARLERADGWLIARGSAGFDHGAPVMVMLKPVIY